MQKWKAVERSPERARRDSAIPVRSRSTSASDIAFVLSLSSLYVISRAVPKFAVTCVVGMAVSLVGFAIIELRSGVRRPRDVGIRVERLGSSFLFCSWLLAPVVLAGAVLAAVRGIYHPEHFLIALLIYPFWGLVQQTLFQGMFLESFRRAGLPILGVVVTSVLFVGVHYPSRVLMAYTAVAGPVFSWLYLRRPNVLPLAFYHGVLGAIVYYVVRQKDVIGPVLVG